ncbi:hypothetical protein [Cytobacillus praedii]|uniref:hypothetical protein n=1 Tax=Cytobacillus praedii TaxID=1742358 RepID=UPI00070E8181|nr:hypothetical protein [Cytobacillus praedii]
MNSFQLYSELDLLNLIITMSLESKTGDIDNIFFKEGYKIVSIDRSVLTNMGTIKYDIYLSNQVKDISLGFELKGFKASNLTSDQLNKYQSLPIKQYLLLGGAFYQDLDNHRLQTIIGINKSRESLVKEFIQLNGFTFPLLLVDQKTSSIEISTEQLIDNELYLKLKNILFDTLKIPTFIFYDKESKLHHIAPRIINKIFQYAKLDMMEFSVDKITEETYCGIPGLNNVIGIDIKKSVVGKIKKILKEMASNEFSSYIVWNSSNKKWEIKRINSKSHPNTDTAFLQLGKQYVDRLRNGMNLPTIGFEQLTLFDYDEVLEEI